ncbi:MAG TPA: EAL domain-containing protein [Solirubrobacteraceae bacterium]|jgi:diguanylate cyclase (GGDEF)-like protein/PAS domain S-box-containing protein
MPFTTPPLSAGRSFGVCAHETLSAAEIGTLLDQLPAILYISEVGVEGRWLYLSAGAEAILGFSPAEWIEDPGLWARRMHPDDRARMFAREESLVEPSMPDEYRLLHRDGRTVWVRDEAALVTDAEGRLRWHGVISDITDRKLAEAELERRAEVIRYQAVHDPLTNLPNRLLFQDRLVQALARPGAQIAVVLLDLDNFKLVNDSLGHAAGDELLMQIAPRLGTALRPGDTIARLGGDEFVVLLEEIPDERSAARVGERIVAAFELPFELTSGEHFTKASLGIAIAGAEGTEPANLIRDADAAMYQAKARGRARFEIFDRAMRARTVERLSVENDLRRALSRGELHVVYQPIVSLRDLSIVSVEALLRWQHPTRGLLVSSDFIPVAEESGLIGPIGRFVLDSACSQAARWHALSPDARPLGVSVNLSVRQLTQRNFQMTVATALAGSALEPSSLCLEITESVLLEDPRGVADTIRRLSRLGVRFVLDDFGTGYSSLAYLAGLPIDGLKVDRSFVSSLGVDERSTAITTAIVRMAHALSLEVTAEGVETAHQLGALRAHGCELAQGFLFHRPLAAEAVTKLLLAENGGVVARRGETRTESEPGA